MRRIPGSSGVGIGVFAAVFWLCAGEARGDDLADLAAQMAPGTWAELPQTNISDVLGQGMHEGNVAPYALRGIWDAAGGTLYFVGGDHGEPALKLFSYETATNTWHDLGVTPVAGHGYDHLTIDPSSRVLYHRQYGIGSDGNHVWQWPIVTSGPWSEIEPWPIGGYIQVAIGSDWFEKLDGVGPAGALVVYNCGQPGGELVFWDPADQAWFDNVQGFGGDSVYNCFIEYSAVHNVALLGGGGTNANSVWRLDADRTLTPMPDAPVGVGIQMANVVPDPGTGNFLVMGYGQLWELDPTGAGTWAQLGGPAVPPAAVGNPGSPELDSVISAEIADYGVDMYVTCHAYSCVVHVYKHTDAPVDPRGTGSSTSSSTTGAGGGAVGASGAGATSASSGTGTGVGGEGARTGELTDAPSDDAGCSCSEVRWHSSEQPQLAWLGVALATSLVRRRRRTR